MPDQNTHKTHPEQSRDASDAACERLRGTIRKLQTELAERAAQDRPMPSSVMRAYQKLIDRHLQALDAETAKQVCSQRP